jgi:anion-transporting  ArsA/GET3 family ATPase
VTIVAGKGGVGKTTVTATLAMAAARLGLKALVIEVEGKSGLPALFGHSSLDYEEQVLYTADTPQGPGEVRARTLTPDESLVEYLRDHGLKRISKRLADTGALDMVATATPGIKDVLILGKVKSLESNRAADVIIVDAPAAGHAITFLSSAEGLLDAVKVGPIETQAREVRSLLTDASRCQVVLVTLPEETPVNELIETAYSLEDRVGIKLGPVVVNGIFPPLPGLDTPAAKAAKTDGTALSPEVAAALDAAAKFRRDREALQIEQIARLARELPLDQIRLPFVFRSDLGLDALGELSDRLTEQLTALETAMTGA